MAADRRALTEQRVLPWPEKDLDPTEPTRTCPLPHRLTERLLAIRVLTSLDFRMGPYAIRTASVVRSR